MTRRGRWSLLCVLSGCGPTTVMSDGTGSGSASGSSDEAAPESSDESGAPPLACRELPAQLAAGWSTIIDPDTIARPLWVRPTAEGGALVADELALLVLDAAGAPRSVQWFDMLAPTSVELFDGQIWVAGFDDALVVARYDENGELARGERMRQPDEQVTGMARTPEGGALVLAVGQDARLETIDEGMAFGDVVTIELSSELPWLQLLDGGLVLATTRDADGGHLTAFDREGTQRWRTALPLPLFEQSYQLTSAAALGDVLYVHVAQVDYAASPPQSSYWLYGVGIDDGTLRFELTTSGGPIAATPCGGLYRVEPDVLPGEPPRLRLVEYDAFGVLHSETELVIPPPPVGFWHVPTPGLVVHADGSLLVFGEMWPNDGNGTVGWAARY